MISYKNILFKKYLHNLFFCHCERLSLRASVFCWRGNPVLKYKQQLCKGLFNIKLVVLVVLSYGAIATAANNKEPKILTSDTAICKRSKAKDVCTYSGSAKMVEGASTLQASQLVISKIIGGKVNNVTASGGSRYSKTGDKDQKPLDADADSIIIDFGKNVMVLEDNAQMIEGASTLTAKRIVVYRKKGGKIKKIVATGEHSHYSKAAEAEQKPFDAVADLITIYPGKKLMVLEGNGKMTVGEDKYNGPRIEYKFK